MTTNALVPLAPRFFNHHLTSQYFLIPASGQHAEEIVLTPRNHSAPGLVDNQSGHPIPFWDQERLHKRTVTPHDFLFDYSQYRPDYDDQKASSKFTHIQDRSDTYDRDGIINTSPMVKGVYVNLYL